MESVPHNKRMTPTMARRVYLEVAIKNVVVLLLFMLILLYLATCVLVWVGYQSVLIGGGFYHDWILAASILILLSLFVFDTWNIVCAVEQQLEAR